jgi:oleandomycin transport system ATP-binding protein
MWEVVRRLVTDGSTVLLTTQYLDEADALADEISVIDHGKVIAHDTPEGLKLQLGGQRIRVKPVDRDRLADVGRILADISGNVPQPTGRDELTVAVNDEGALAATVGRLADDGISVNELSLHLPSLDEVFLTLTGERLAPEATTNENGTEVAA